MSFNTCKNAIAAIWFIGFGIIAIVFVVQAHVGGKYGESVLDAWKWFVSAFGPAMVPTTAFLLGFVIPSSGAADRRLPILPGILAIFLVTLYLISLLGLLVAEPLFNTGTPEEWLDRTSVPIVLIQTVFQAIVDLSLGMTIAIAK